MNIRAIRTIVRKDLKVVFQSKAVTIPLIVVPVIMLMVLPGLAALAPMLEESGANTGDLQMLLAQMPASLQAQLEHYNMAQQIIVLAVVYLMAPLYLIVPMMVASVIAADSFAGEKERKTLEALLYTPTTDQELFYAKILAAWLPAVAIAWGGFVLYSIVVNLTAWPTMGEIFFPNAMWFVLALFVAPAVAGIGLGATVIISARVQSFQEAYQMGGIVVVPIIALVIAQATGVMYFSLGMVVLLGIVLWAVALGLLWWGSQRFRREEMVARL